LIELWKSQGCGQTKTLVPVAIASANQEQGFVVDIQRCGVPLRGSH